MTDHLVLLEQELTELHEILSAGGTNKNDLIQYAKTKVATLLAYIDSTYPDAVSYTHLTLPTNREV